MVMPKVSYFLYPLVIHMMWIKLWMSRQYLMSYSQLLRIFKINI